ncbi:stealth family protein [Streptomyces sp. NPDC091259]|uniref:stealth family protein n=1 Tax=Streptomyces sp. NPDC091259 TaxID=3365976 RepID=UPI00381D1C74
MNRPVRIPLPGGLRRVVTPTLRLLKIPTQPAPALAEGIPAAEGAAGHRTREEELLESLPGVVRDRGRLARVRDDLLPSAAREANLRVVAEALEAARVPYGLVPDGGLVHRVAISPGDRPRALRALAGAFAGQLVYVRLLGLAGEPADVLAETLLGAVADAEVDQGPPTSTPDDGQHPRVTGLRVHQPVVTSGRTLRYGADHGCDVEFWEPSGSGAGGVASLRPTPYGWWVPSMTASVTRRIGDRGYPVIDALAGCFPHDITFPIDAVITWVDSSDPQWRRRRDEAAADSAAATTDRAEHRYRDRGELRHCLRSIAAHAPWIRRIFIVTDAQVPHWLATEHPQITVVDHQDLFADPAGLPVFNSHAIESRLHRVPGLAEHFLYFNDDIFLGREQQPQDYFLASGLPKVFHDQRAVPPAHPDTDDQDDVFTASQKATRQAVERAAGRTYPYILAHAPYPLSRSLYAAVEARLPDLLESVARSVFRSAADVAPVTLAAHLALAEGRAVEGDLSHAFIATDRSEQIRQLPDLLHSRSADAICLADDAGSELSPSDQHRAVTAFLEAYFPVPSPYERS